MLIGRDYNYPEDREIEVKWAGQYGGIDLDLESRLMILLSLRGHNYLVTIDLWLSAGVGRCHSLRLVPGRSHIDWVKISGSLVCRNGGH